MFSDEVVDGWMGELLDSGRNVYNLPILERLFLGRSTTATQLNLYYYD
jgi:hypothetical protein